MVSHMVSYEQQLRQEVLLNIERLQAGELSDSEDEEEEVGLRGLLLQQPAGRCWEPKTQRTPATGGWLAAFSRLNPPALTASPGQQAWLVSGSWDFVPIRGSCSLCRPGAG